MKKLSWLLAFLPSIAQAKCYDLDNPICYNQMMGEVYGAMAAAKYATENPGPSVGTMIAMLVVFIIISVGGIWGVKKINNRGK